MKRSKVIEARRRHVNPEVKERVTLSFQIVDRILRDPWDERVDRIVHNYAVI